MTLSPLAGATKKPKPLKKKSDFSQSTKAYGTIGFFVIQTPVLETYYARSTAKNNDKEIKGNHPLSTVEW